MNSLAVLRMTRACRPKRVLVDVDHFRIAQHVERERIQPGHVAAEDQRRGHQAPHRHVGILLVGRERRLVAYAHAVPVADIADEQIIGIVPAAGPGIFPVPSVAETDVIEARQAAAALQAQVAGGPPALAHLAAPFPDLAHAVLAEVQHDVAVLLLQFGRDELVGLLQMGQILPPATPP